MNNIFDFDDNDDINNAPIYDNISALRPEPVFVNGLNPEQKEAVLDYLLESSITSSYLLAEAQIKALEGDNNLTIYEEGLEIGYKVSFESNLESAGLATDENKSLFTTTSSVNLFEILKINNSSISLF